MDLETVLRPVVEGLVPQTLPESAVNALCYDLGRLLASPSRSISQLQALLDAYESQVPCNGENGLKWRKLFNIVQLLLGLESYDEMARHLAAFHSMIVDNVMAKPVTSSPLNDMALNMRRLETHDSLLSPLRPMSLQAESFENLDRFSDRRSLISSPKGYTGHRTVTLNSLADPYFLKMVSEDEILKHVPYTLLATTSDFFPIEQNKIKIPTNVPNTESGMLHLIFEASLLYQELKRKVDQCKRGEISPMKKALAIQVERTLRNYTGFVNSLSAYHQTLTLKSVYYEIYDHIIKLRFFDGFIRNFDKTSGDSYLMISSSLAFHGDLLVRRLCVEISENLLSLYVEYLINWLTLAKLDATYDEFFIEKVESLDPIPTHINPSKVPEFIPKNVAYEILMIGKSLIFLGKHCKELQCTNDMSRKYQHLYKKIEHKRISSEFYDIVHQQYEEVTKLCFDILMKRFYFKEIVFVLKDILLMGKSDMIDMLVRKASKVLGTSSASLSSYELTRYLQEAVKYSSMRNLLNRADSNHIINGLDARVLDLGHGSIGWDVFTLDYVLDGPLAIVLNVNRPNGKKEYLRIFNFLWRFKKNTFFYNEEWLRTNQLIRDFKKVSQNSPLVRDIIAKLSKTCILRSQLQQFSSKLESYCFRSIIDKKFKSFDEKMMLTDQTSGRSKYPTVTLKSGVIMLDGILRPQKNIFKGYGDCSTSNCSKNRFNIDEVDQMHNDYLSSILSHKLLAPSTDNRVGAYSGQPYPTSVILVLNSIFEFITTYSALNDVAHEVLIQINLRGQQQILNNLLIRFNTILKDVVSNFKKFQEISYLFIKDLRSDGDDDLASLGGILR
ncbi:Spc98p TDEL_0B05060 [Torulaspora delbrueckii]|uniref:Spindle pole body component n=1 Tax=Torulaspora delbrueckii TaxID=4950 RepID=G8ZPU1_TORDE|nr:hypothetical protein TDEL_0B05060 [Torulaspora delbrueckii]CCE90635.1 hypothetical protein TDEL_0B05060 [Torulaspora delbrueckii]